VKKELIKAQRHAITLQRLSAVRKQVIPATEIDDALVAEPPAIVDADWDDGILTLVFDKTISREWQSALKNMGSYASVMGAGPESYRFQDNKARVAVHGESAQDAINHFNNWIPRASAVLGQRLQRQRQEQEEQMRDQLRREREAVEQREKVLRSLRF
jgi:hypothetical protein